MGGGIRVEGYGRRDMGGGIRVEGYGQRGMEVWVVWVFVKQRAIHAHFE